MGQCIHSLVPWQPLRKSRNNSALLVFSHITWVVSAISDADAQPSSASQAGHCAKEQLICLLSYTASLEGCLTLISINLMYIKYVFCCINKKCFGRENAKTNRTKNASIAPC